MLVGRSLPSVTTLGILILAYSPNVKMNNEDVAYHSIVVWRNSRKAQMARG